MELVLNIYNKDRSIEKTYRKQDYEVLYGPVEDLLDLLDLESVNLENTDDMLSVLSRLLRSRTEVIHPLLFDIFEDLTAEELRRAKTVDIINVLCGVAGFSFDQLKTLTFRKKR